MLQNSHEAIFITLYLSRTYKKYGIRLENFVATTLLKRLHFLKIHHGINELLNPAQDFASLIVQFVMI